MWSKLPLDVLILISKGLTLDDFMMFSSVCRSWHYVYTITKHIHHRCKAPWLMYSGGEEEPNTAIFYNISQKKELKIGKQPGLSLHKRIFLGSAHGWLITADERSELSLVNPFTRLQIDLPLVTTFDNFFPNKDDAYGEVTHYRIRDNDRKMYDGVFTAKEVRHFWYGKATLVCCEGGKVDDDYTVVLILPKLGCIAFAKRGDKKWTILTNYVQSREAISSDVYETKVYTITWLGTVECWDFSGKNHVPEPVVIYFPEDQKVASCSCEYLFYLVQTPWGDIWHVRRKRKFNHSKGNHLTRKISIYKVDFAKNKLISVQSMGDYALFVGGNVPLCISCKDNPNLKPNSVYFLDDATVKSSDDRMRMFRKDIGIYCFDDQSIELIKPENSLLKWPPLVWLQPTLVWLQPTLV